MTLSFPGITHGDGIVSTNWIDGGLVGAAALSFLSPTQGSFPAQFQPFVRLVTTDGLTQVHPAVASGFDLLSGQTVARSVVILVFDPTARRIFVFPAGNQNAFRYRPETLSIITTFNTDFPRAFATFAQKQNLAVCWIGCQEELTPPAACPGQHPHEPCGDASSED